MTGKSPDDSKKELWDENRWGGFVTGGGILLVISGLGGIVAALAVSVLYASGLPSSALGYIPLFSQHQDLAYSLWSFRIVEGLWLVPASLAVYLALKRVDQPMAIFGTILSLEYIFYDINVTEVNLLNLVRLSQGYASATTAATRASYVLAATSGVKALPADTFFSLTIGAVGWLLWSLIMSRSFFGKQSAVFGVTVNVIGILGGVGAAVPGTPSASLGIFTTLGAAATALWFVFIGIKLYQHGRHIWRAGMPPAAR